MVEGFQRSEWSRKHGRDGNDEKVEGARLRQGKPNPRVRTCVVFVGLSFQH